MDQRIRFCSIPAGRIAYAEVGAGPGLVLPARWVSHLELDWESPDFRAFVEALAIRRRVIRYDPLGMGLSDRSREGGRGGLEGELEALAAVVGAAELGHTALLGISLGACLSVAFAARAPAAVEALVLYGGYARGAELAAPEVRESMLSLVSAHWGLGSRLLADVFMPEAGAEELETFARFQREAAPPERAAARLGFVYSVDVAAELARIDTPTLVLHRRDDGAIPFELGRALAASVPGARLVTLEGGQHVPWRGDAAAIVTAVGEFLDGDAAAGALLRARWQNAGPLHGEPPGLSVRELEVLRLVAAGLSNAEIAERLVVSPHTVHRHVANVRAKLRQPSRAAAVARAGRLGLL
jgi:pimeloyl-ACP methyl ester carboxylesterase/DNA-binding CsgD family transcriptional regulator